MERKCFPASPRRYELLSEPDTGCIRELTRSASCDDVLRHSGNVVADQEPLSFNQATKMEVWNDAMKAELEALDKNGTWEFTKLPSGYDCTAWTDVKHNLYLYQLEMSFVKELQHSKCLCAYQHSEQNQKDLNVPRKQFNISKTGFCQKINCVRAGKPKLLKLCNTMKHGKRTISYGLATSAPKFSSNKPLLGDLFGLAREGMGQNFLDEDSQRKSSFTPPTRRWKRSSALSNAST